MIKFAPKRVPGSQIGAQTRQGKASLLANELSFSLLIFTNELIEMTCSFTNRYAYAHIGSNKSSNCKWRLGRGHPDRVQEIYGLSDFHGNS